MNPAWLVHSGGALKALCGAGQSLFLLPTARPPVGHFGSRKKGTNRKKIGLLSLNLAAHPAGMGYLPQQQDFPYSGGQAALQSDGDDRNPLC